MRDTREPAKREVRRAWSYVKWRLSNAVSVARYGRSAPRFRELCYLKPSRRLFGLRRKTVRLEESSSVLGGCWDMDQVNVTDLPAIRQCLLHWVEGLSWEQSGAFGRMLEELKLHGEVDGCRTFEDVVARYRRLDAVYAHAKATGRLRTSAERSDASHRQREHGGIVFHFDRHGLPVFGGYGQHRLAIAIALNLELIPAQVGVVHKCGVRNWRANTEPPPARAAAADIQVG